jgi:hypothetical protein
VGTEDAGVFRSDDEGGYWVAVGKPLPAGVAVAALGVKGKHLFAATEQRESRVTLRAAVWKIAL